MGTLEHRAVTAHRQTLPAPAALQARHRGHGQVAQAEPEDSALPVPREAPEKASPLEAGPSQEPEAAPEPGAAAETTAHPAPPVWTV